VLKIQVRYESSLADEAGCRSEVFDVEDGATLADLRSMIVEKHGTAVTGASREYQWRHSTSYVLYAVDGLVVPEEELSETKVVEGMVFSIVPPTSGG